MDNELPPHFDLSGVSSYEEADERVEWDLPETFNMGTATIDRHADERGRVALFFENVNGDNETWTYWQLRNRCNQFGNFLSDVGIGEGDRVGVHLPQSPGVVIGHTGLWRAGAVSIPLPYMFEIGSLQFRLDDANANALIVSEEKRERVTPLLDQIDSLAYLFVIGEAGDDDRVLSLYDELDAYDRDFEPVETTPEDTGAVMYSSGSTGEPKGIVHGHSIMLGHIPGYYIIYNMDLEGVYYTPADWGYGGGLLDLVVPGLYFGQTVLAFNRGPFDPQEQLDLFQTYGVTHSFMPPTALNMLRNVDEEPDELPLEVLGAGGESLSTAAHEWATERGIVINEFYGQTEANFLTANCEALWGSKPGSMGLPMPGRDIDIIDDEGERLDPDEVGEVALRNPEDDPIHFKQYLNKPEKTEAVRLGDWHLTEDLAEKDDKGHLWYHSRKDDVIISSGYRLSPVEIEDAIMKYDDVANVAVVGVPHEVRGEIPKAFVKVAAGVSASEDLRADIQDHVKETLAKHEYPREVEFIEEFPTTESGKIRRKDLRERELADGA